MLAQTKTSIIGLLLQTFVSRLLWAWDLVRKKPSLNTPVLTDNKTILIILAQTLVGETLDLFN